MQNESCDIINTPGADAHASSIRQLSSETSAKEEAPSIQNPASGPPPLTPDTCHLPPPFPRFPGETPRAFGAFCAWLDLGQTRSLQAAADILGESLGTLKNWSSRFRWNDRLHTLNSHRLEQNSRDRAELERKHATDWAERLNHFREQEWDAAQKLLSAAQCFLESFGEEALERMTLAQVSRALSISSRIGRSAIAGAELHTSSEPALAPVQQQMLDALKRLSSPSPVAAGVPPAVEPGILPGGTAQSFNSGEEFSECFPAKSPRAPVAAGVPNQSRESSIKDQESITP
jgi:hypothetical protein